MNMSHCQTLPCRNPLAIEAIEMYFFTLNATVLLLLHYFLKDTYTFNLIFNTEGILFTSFFLNFLMYLYSFNKYIKNMDSDKDRGSDKNRSLNLRSTLLLMSYSVFFAVVGLLILYHLVIFEEGNTKDIVYFTGITGSSYVELFIVLWTIYILSWGILNPFFMLAILVVNLMRR